MKPCDWRECESLSVAGDLVRLCTVHARIFMALRLAAGPPRSEAEVRAFNAEHFKPGVTERIVRELAARGAPS